MAELAKKAIEEAIMASTTNNLLGLLWQKELPWYCQFSGEALVEDVVVSEEVVEALEAEAAAEVVEVNKQTFLLALETGNAQTSTAETQTLPGETNATNVKPLNQPEVVMTEVETAAEPLWKDAFSFQIFLLK